MNKYDEIKIQTEELFYDFIKSMNCLRKEIISGKKIKTLIHEYSTKLIDIRDKLSSDPK